MIIGFLLLNVPATPSGQITLSPGPSHIRTSVRVKPGVYTLSPNNGGAAIQVEADGITLDFQGATLRSPATSGGRQEAYDGVGIAINGHRNVTVKNAVVHGYQYNIKAIKCSDLRLENCELGQSRSQKIVDGDSANYIWLSIRDIGAWRTYGCGAWLEDCSGSIVRGVHANQSQNGLMLVNSNKNTVVGCDFGYDSGWGLAMWNSSDNLICWNQTDFVNRPWSGSWGGDSSDVVLSAGSHRNVFAYNSMTHGGDGFFLTNQNDVGYNAEGKYFNVGPCNNNVVAYNDGSWSTANAFESTFSTGNVFYRNIADDSGIGFWLGYSQKNTVRENEVIRSRYDGIAHEHGADNDYIGNVIKQTGGTAIHLYSNLGARAAQVPSARNRIVGNKIVKARSAYDLTNSTDYYAGGNVVRDAPLPAGFAPLAFTKAPKPYKVPRLAEIMAMKPKGFKLYRDSDGPKGWDWLAPTAYGMRDYRKMLVPWMKRDSKTLKLSVNPKKVAKIDLPDWLMMKNASAPNERLVTIKPSNSPTGEYRDFRIQVTGKSGQKQTIAGTLLDADWHVRWYKWFRNEHDAYADTAAWDALFAGPPLKEEVLPALPNIQGYAAPEPGLPIYYYAFVATTRIKLDAGTYRFNTLSDDGIRVLVDGKPVVDNWTWHAGTNDAGEVTVTSGLHEIEVHYCQENGAAALSVHWTRLAG